MKKIKIVSLSLLIALIGTGLGAQENVKEQLTVPLSEPGKSYQLTVGLVDGSINVTGYDGKDIIIDAEGDMQKNKNEGPETSHGMRRLYSHNLSVTAEEKNNKVNISSDQPNKTIRLSIKIPKGASSIKLETVNNGNITVSNVNGEMEITNVNGSIKLTDVGGSVVANTVNGDVTANFKTIDQQAPMAFATLNGNVDVSFPANLKANLKLKSDNGGIYTDFEIAVDKSISEIEHSTDGRMYKLSVKDWVSGKIGGGGPEILMKNMNGNIYARKSR